MDAKAFISWPDSCLQQWCSHRKTFASDVEASLIMSSQILCGSSQERESLTIFSTEISGHIRLILWDVRMHASYNRAPSTTRTEWALIAVILTSRSEIRTVTHFALSCMLHQWTYQSFWAVKFSDCNPCIGLCVTYAFLIKGLSGALGESVLKSKHQDKYFHIVLLLLLQ